MVKKKEVKKEQEKNTFDRKDTKVRDDFVKEMERIDGVEIKQHTTSGGEFEPIIRYRDKNVVHLTLSKVSYFGCYRKTIDGVKDNVKITDAKEIEDLRSWCLERFKYIDSQATKPKSNNSKQKKKEKSVLEQKAEIIERYNKCQNSGIHVAPEIIEKGWFQKLISEMGWTLEGTTIIKI